MVRRVLKITISFLYYTLAIAGWGLLQKATRHKAQRLVVLVYHNVTDCQRAAFARQMDAVLRAGKPVPLGDLVADEKPGLYLGVTFDDGCTNILQYALPALHKRNIPATIFLPSGNLGAAPRWRTANGRCRRGLRVMTAEEIRQAVGPLIQIGSHTHSHPALGQLSDDRALAELLESKQRLEEHCNSRMEAVAFPYGDYTERTVTLARHAGYRCACTLDPLIVPADRRQFLIGRFRVDPEDWAIEFWLKIRGAYAWLAAFRSFRKNFHMIIKKTAPVCKYAEK